MPKKLDPKQGLFDKYDETELAINYQRCEKLLWWCGDVEDVPKKKRNSRTIQEKKPEEVKKGNKISKTRFFDRYGETELAINFARCENLQDHFLVIVKLKQKIPEMRKNKEEKLKNYEWIQLGIDEVNDN